ncbi:hypothetical protein HK097_002410, partial [Rhizophlyctis rosea]
MAPITTKGFITGTTPFTQFATLIQSLPLTPHKHLFKTYPNSFTTEEALTTLQSLAPTSIASEEAESLLSGYVDAGLIKVLGEGTAGLVKAFNEGLVKKGGVGMGRKTVFLITGKGWGVVGDFKSGRVDGGEDGEIIYLDRTESGDLNLSSQSLQTLFKSVAGQTSNIWTPEKQSSRDASTDADADSHHPSSRRTSIDTDQPSEKQGPGRDSLLLKDRFTNLKTHTSTFHGTEITDWIFLRVSVLSRDEAVHIVSQFLLNNWITSIDSTKNEEFRDGVGLYQFTKEGAMLAGWRKEDVPGVKGRGGKSRAGAFGGEDTKISVENLAKFENFLRKSQEVLNSSSFAEDGRKGLRDDQNLDIGVVGGGGAKGWEDDGQVPKPLENITSLPPSRPSVTSLPPPALAAGRRKRASTIGGSQPPLLSPDPPTTRKARISSVGGAPSDPIPRPSETYKETNTQKLATILRTPQLRTAFRTFLSSMYCPENIDFLEDVEKFRLSYGGRNFQLEELVYVEESQFGSTASSGGGGTLSGRASTFQHPALLETSEEPTPSSESDHDHQHQQPPQNPNLIPHAISLYLKYVPKDAPQEVNIGSNLKNQIGEVVQPLSHLFPLILTPSDDPTSPTSPTGPFSPPHSFPTSSQHSSSSLINPKKLLKNPQDITKFPTHQKGFDPDMFATAESH